MRFRCALPCLLVLVASPTFGQDSSRNKRDDPAQIGNRDVGKGVNLYSLEKEMALGKQLAQEVQRQAKVVEDPLISEYINRIGQNLVRSSDAKVPFTFQVVEGDSPNAFALPGGYVFVYTALIKIADEEDELAAAMAHEIAHVAARHMTRLATKSQIAKIAGIPVGVILGGGIGGAVIRQGIDVGLPAAFLHFTRKDESEADYLGVQYLYAAGYDPNGAISIFEKLESLERKRPGTVARIFSTHPMDATRIHKTEEEIGRILPAKAEYVVNTSDYTAIRQRMISLGAGKRATQDERQQPIVRRDLIE
ncbi:MAG: M48 family metallopeptidase [Candidatus Solibacter sp.]|nr:M48 family metallopeptidase [Candidatus Solibacter sp.]